MPKIWQKQNQFIPKMIHMFSEARGRADRMPEATIMLRNKKIDKKSIKENDLKEQRISVWTQTRQKSTIFSNI